MVYTIQYTHYTQYTIHMTMPMVAKIAKIDAVKILTLAPSWALAVILHFFAKKNAVFCHFCLVN